MNCPNCYTALHVADRAGIEIDFCPSCRGVWLDRGELDKIIERSGAHAFAGAAAQPPSRRGAPPAEYEYEDRRDSKKKRKKKKKSEWLEEIFDIFD